MSRTPRNRKKRRVAQRATPEQVIIKYPPPLSLKNLSKASDVLTQRRINNLVSWRVIAHELGQVDRGTLSRVAHGKREPSALLIAKLNSVYGCHLHIVSKRITIVACPVCGELPQPRHHCKSAPKRPHQTYTLSAKRAREIGAAMYIVI